MSGTTHTGTGRRSIVRHIGETLSCQFGCEVAWLLLGGGAMVPEYEQLGRVWMADDDPAQIGTAVAELRRDGFELAVTNTTLSGAAVPHLKAAGFRVVSLIHELPGIIGELRAEENLASILEQGDTIVVPAENVAHAIASDAPPDVRERIVVRPQGLYKELGQPVGRARASAPSTRNRRRTRASCSTSGSATFARASTRSSTSRSSTASRADDLHFVWVGNLHGDAERWLRADVGGALRDRIHLVPYTDDVADIYFGADAFFLSSREDPFPSVVLEAMAAGLPVVGFGGTGGTDDLIAEHGWLVDRDDLVGVAVALDEASREGDERARAARARLVVGAVPLRRLLLRPAAVPRPRPREGLGGRAELQLRAVPRRTYAVDLRADIPDLRDACPRRFIDRRQPRPARRGRDGKQAAFSPGHQ